MECHFKLLSLYKNNNLVFHVFNIYLNLNNAPRRLYLLVTFRISSFCFHLNPVIFKFGFPGGAVVKNAPASTRDRRCGLDPWVGKIDPLEEEVATHSSILSWRIPWTEEPVHGVTNSWTQLSYWTCTYNKAGPSEKHWPIFRWWSLLCGKSCILVLEKSILMQLNLSHTIINSKSWNAKKYMVVLTPTVSIHLWKLTSVKIKSFLITDTV